MYKPLADSTLLRMPKKEIIELLRTAEHNAKVSQEFVDQQAENLKDWKPLVHGCFEPCFDENGNWRQGFAKCSNCGKEYYAQAINHFGYCPNCGAKMDGERKDGGDG